MNLLSLLLPEIILGVVAAVLFLIGTSDTAGMRRVGAMLAFLALGGVFLLIISRDWPARGSLVDEFNAVRVGAFALYIKLIASGIGALLVCLLWPDNDDATGNAAIQYGTETAEFFGLLLLAITGIFLVADANNLIQLFLGIELASIPTYIMVSVSRPLPMAQEAGVKYFFLGAMSAAIMLMGFTYLYGVTGTTDITAITAKFAEGVKNGIPTFSGWQMLATLLLLAGFLFKIAAFPFHFYAGDVYQGAATPVSAILSFVPKTSGFVAIVKLLLMISGGTFIVPVEIEKLLWILAAVTMTFGNILGLIPHNVKRVLACSSIAHSGYMLVALATLASASHVINQQTHAFDPALAASTRELALAGLLFYLAAYGVMNVGAFGVLMLLPAIPPPRGWPGGVLPPATSAETYEDLAGTGRRSIILGLSMAISCFALMGIPLTFGFIGKVYLIQPALQSGLPWIIALVGIMMLNAAISSAYYLRIIAAMFLRPEVVRAGNVVTAPMPRRSLPLLAGIGMSTAITIAFGAILPLSEILSVTTRSAAAGVVETAPVTPSPTAQISTH